MPLRPIAAPLLVLVAGVLALAAPACQKDDPPAPSPSPSPAPGSEPEPVPAPPASAAVSTAAGDPAAVELTPDEQVAIEKVMAARDEMADIAEASAGDCDQAARQIGAVVGRSRDLLAASAALERDLGKRTWIGEKYGARMLASSSKLMALIEKCDEHEELTRLFESLE